MSQKHYAISLDGYNYESSIFDSYDEALKEGLEVSLGDFYIAETEKFDPTMTDIGERVLEIMQDKAYEECGESAEDWFFYLTDDELREFNDNLNKVIIDFVENHQSFQLYKINNPKMIERTD